MEDGILQGHLAMHTSQIMLPLTSNNLQIKSPGRCSELSDLQHHKLIISINMNVNKMHEAINTYMYK